MPYLNNEDFFKVHEALKLGRDLALVEPDIGRLGYAVLLMDKAVDATASPQLRAAAENRYGSDDIEIDDEGVGTSEAAGGTWVQAWVWVARDEDEEDEALAGQPNGGRDVRPRNHPQL